MRGGGLIFDCFNFVVTHNIKKRVCDTVDEYFTYFLKQNECSIEKHLSEIIECYVGT